MDARALIESWTEPVAQLEPGRRWRAQVVSTALLAVLAAGSVSISVQLVAVPGFFPTFATIAPVLGLIFIAYRLARSSRPELGERLALSVVVTAPFLAALVNPDDPHALAFSVVGCALGGFVLSPRSWALLATVTFVALLGAAAIAPDAGHVGAAGLYLVACAGVAVARLHAQRVERERARLVERLAASERMKTTGIMAAAAGHEIGNALVGLLGNLSVVQAARQGDPAIADAREAGNHIHRLLQDLRTVSRPGTDAVAFRVVQAVDSALRLARHHVDCRAHVVVDVPEDLEAYGSISRFSQVLLNLVLNAAKAFASSDPHSNRIAVRAREIGDSVEVVVEDNGPGMPPEVAASAFEPFFTTRADGTGLGLFVCAEIVRSMGGTIAVARSGAAGTTMRFTMPLTAV